MDEQIRAYKMQAAARAVEFVKSNSVIGLGTGSTAILAVRIIGEKLKNGELRNIIGIPTSQSTAAEAQQLGISLSTLEEYPVVELTIDGADEVDSNLDAIKGGGGALLREKIVAQASSREIIIVDESKPSPQLGTKWAVPVEVISFGWGSQRIFLESLGASVHLRLNSHGSPYVTDHGNLILDADFGAMADPFAIAAEMERRAGVVEHGLFLNMVSDVIIAGQNGIKHLTR